jgi:PAS domain-containing protein
MGGRDFTENDARLGAAIAAQVGVAWVNLDLLAKSELQAKSLHDEIVAHKRLSSELEESESRFRQMADNIHEAVFLIDLDSGASST